MRSVTVDQVDGITVTREEGGQVQVTPCGFRDCRKMLHFQSGVWWEFSRWGDFRTWRRHPHGSPWSTHNAQVVGLPVREEKR